MAHHVSCDRVGCPSKARMDDSRELAGWIAQHPMDPEAEEDDFKHYCSKDCAVTDMLSSEIPDGVPHD